MKLPARLRLLCRADDGSSFIELAFVAPFLVLLVIGAVDFGRAYYVGLEVANAAHAGAEYASYNQSASTANIQAAAQAAAPDVGLATPTVSYSCECSDGSSVVSSSNCSSSPPSCVANSTRSGTPVYLAKVTTSATYTPLMPWPGIPSTITLTKTAAVRGN